MTHIFEIGTYVRAHFRHYYGSRWINSNTYLGVFYCHYLSLLIIIFSPFLISTGDQSPRARVPVHEPPAAPTVPVQHAREGQAAPFLWLWRSQCLLPKPLQVCFWAVLQPTKWVGSWDSQGKTQSKASLIIRVHCYKRIFATIFLKRGLLCCCCWESLDTNWIQ